MRIFAPNGGDCIFILNSISHKLFLDLIPSSPTDNAPYVGLDVFVEGGNGCKLLT